MQCWRSSDNIKVILRKHRDVIFDLKLGKGKTYTVEATASDFYNARDKKLVVAKRKELVTFKDGERTHLWVTRGFKGALLLKSDGQLIMRLEPNELDRHQYNADPKTKPAPIIIRLGHDSRPAPAVASKTARAAAPPTPIPHAAAAPVDDGCSVVCVVEGKVKGMPAAISAHFAKGGGKSGFADIDPNEVATRNWIWGQIAGTAAYTKDNWDWLRASIDTKGHAGFKLVRARVHLVRGKVRFYFSGFSKFNTVFGSGGFGPGNERIMNIFAGVGKTASSFGAVAKGVAGSFKGNALVSFIFGSATAIAEWKSDVTKDGYDLASGLLMSLLKAIVAAALVVAPVAVIVMLAMMAGAAALPVIAVGAITVAAGIAIGYLVEAVDKKLGKMIGGSANTDGLSAVMTPYLRKAGKEIQESWDYLVSKFPTDYKELHF